jgi:hypothetical protein
MEVELAAAEKVKGHVLQAKVVFAGRDILVSVCGGDRPHIGSISVAVARDSLLGDGSVSATVSTLNLVGHKDNEVGDTFARRIAIAAKSTCVVTCGIHIDGLRQKEAGDVLCAAERLLNQLLDQLETSRKK